MEQELHDVEIDLAIITEVMEQAKERIKEKNDT